MSKESIPSNHMEIYWHDYAGSMGKTPIVNASLTEKASVIGRTGLMLLSCGTGAWRVRSSMNTIATKLGITCTVNIGLMSIDYTCFDGHDCFSQSLCLTNTGVNTSKLNRLEHFVIDFEKKGENMTGEELHAHLDEIEKLHGLYSPVALGFAAALACSAFTFLLGGGPVEMLLAFLGAGVGNFLRCKLAKHHFTLFLCIVSSVAAACLVYTGMLRVAEEIFNMPLVLVPAEKELVGYYRKVGFTEAYPSERLLEKQDVPELSAAELNSYSVEEITAAEYQKIREQKLMRDGFIAWDEAAIRFAMDFNCFCGGRTVKVVWSDDISRDESAEDADILMYCPENGTLHIIETTLGEEQFEELLPELMAQTKTERLVYDRKGIMVLSSDDQDRQERLLADGYFALSLA